MLSGLYPCGILTPWYDCFRQSGILGWNGFISSRTCSSENRKCWFDIVYSKKNSTLAVPLLPAGLGVASMLIALLVRVLFTYICVLCAGFNVKEKAFIALAWMPKATVQVCAHSLNLVLPDFLQWVLRRSPFFWSFSGCYRLHGFRHGPE